MFTLIAHGHTSVYTDRRTLTSARRRVHRIHSRRQMADAVDAFHPSVAHRQLERDVEYSGTVLYFVSLSTILCITFRTGHCVYVLRE